MADEPTPLQAGGDGRPEWLDPKYTSVEAQARSYSEARAEMTRAQQEAQQAMQYAQSLEERLSELEYQQAEPQQSQSPELPFNPLALQLENARNMGDVQTEMAINAYMASQLADQKINERLQQFQAPQAPDPANTEMFALWADHTARERYDSQYGQGAYDEVRREAAEFLAASPDLLPENATPTQAAERLAWAAEYVQGRKYLAASEQERTQMTAARQSRLMAQGLTQSGATPSTAQDAEAVWAQIKNAPAGSYAELRG